MSIHKDKQIWPDLIRQFKGVRDFPAFELTRNELLPPKKNPF